MTKQNEEISEENEEPTASYAGSNAAENGSDAAGVGGTGDSGEAWTDSGTDESSGAKAEAAAEPELSEFEKAQREAAEMKTRYLRAVADMENYRKRIAREKQDIIRNAAAGVVESLLPVLDNMKLGLQAAENHPEAKDVIDGFKMVDDQLKKSLSEQGLEEVIPDGEPFDPNLHECIAHHPSDEVDEDHVMQTVRAGYRLNDRLIRAANVIVSSGPTNQ